MAALDTIHVVLRTWQVLSAILAIISVACLLHWFGRGLANNVLAALEFAAFVVSLAVPASLLAAVIRFKVAAIRKPLILMLLDGLMTVLSFLSGVTLIYRLGLRDCESIDIPALQGACRATQAAIVCMWIMFTCFAVTNFLSFQEYRRSFIRENVLEE